MKHLKQLHKDLTNSQKLKAYELSGYKPSTFNQYLIKGVTGVQYKLFEKHLKEAKDD